MSTSKIQIVWSKLLPLDESSIKDLDDFGGVYRLSKKADDGKYYVFYIDSSENIKDRLLQLISNEPKTQLGNFLKESQDVVFRYAVIPEKNIQKAVEKQMYRTYLPEYNHEEPKSPLEIEANLN